MRSRWNRLGKEIQDWDINTCFSHIFTQFSDNFHTILASLANFGLILKKLVPKSMMMIYFNLIEIQEFFIGEFVKNCAKMPVFSSKFEKFVFVLARPIFISAKNLLAG